MGEYIGYKNTEVKIGTCENLYYTTYEVFVEKNNNLELHDSGDGSPEEFLNGKFRFSN